jgi:putative membrane protein insertion efficiency factor
VGVLRAVDRLFGLLFIYLIKFYQRFISPVIGAQCRFHPTCSNYALGTLKSKPFLLALGLISTRIIRCNPLHSGGYDPIK